MIQSTMQDRPLLISSILEHGRRVYGESRVITVEEGDDRVASFAAVGNRTAQLANALSKLGVGTGDRVATFCRNTQEHLEAYFASSSMGAVLHTLNIRLSPEQLKYVVNHAEDKVLIIDDDLVPLVGLVAEELACIEHVILVGPGDDSALKAMPNAKQYRYEELIAGEPTEYAWPEIDERAACSICYTSGTTGDPKGVVYSHRSNYLHTLAFGCGNVAGLTDQDCILPIVPMFHANAWGIPYCAWFNGTDILMPGRFLQPQSLVATIEKYQPTLAAAVPAIWTAVLQHVEKSPADLSSIRLVLCGGSAVPRSLMEAFETKLDVRIIQAWGMTELSPLGAIAKPPRGVDGEEAWGYRIKAGRIAAGVEMRVVDDAGKPLPWDGESVGEIEVRGPWITGSYFRVEEPGRFHDGWLRTGDLGHVDSRGYLRITDRAKDVIKSGGEWISSVDLENSIMGHAEVYEAAVIGIPDVKWDERPLACVVLKEGASATASDLASYLSDKVAKFWVPENWTFVRKIPKTSADKFDKKVLHQWHEQNELKVEKIA